MHREDSLRYNHAVVIGGSLSGLTAARVLANHFERVTIIDRDHAAGQAEFRQGVPQARHAHTLQPRGQVILEKLFPGLAVELVSRGAVSVDPANEIVYYENGRWQKPGRKDAHHTLYASRPLLEAALCERVFSLPNLEVLRDFEMVGLELDESGKNVSGVQLRGRGRHRNEQQRIFADVVVDASGRNSQAPQWLARAGYRPPEEWQVDAQVGYASRTYYLPNCTELGWKALYVRPEAPFETRGGVVSPIENERWIVTLFGVNEDYPPTDPSGFERFARSLPGGKLAEALKTAYALDHPAGFRRTANVVRRYDKLPDMPGGFMVVGDAVVTMNPIYAQGMTAALIGVEVMERMLRSASPDLNWAAFSLDFQRRLSREVGRLWRTTVQREWEWPATRLADNTEQLYPALQPV